MTTKRAKAAGRVTRDVLLDAALPQATKTYTVISHSFVINTIKKLLNEKGFTVVNEVYSATDGGQLAYGAFHINYGNDPDLGMLFAFGNSYNKEMKFSCAVGAYVKTNDTSVLSEGGSAWIRKHTGNADDLAEEVIEQQIENAAGYFAQLQADKDAMKQLVLSRRQYAELLGALFVDLKIIGHAQLGLIRKEFEKPSYKYDGDPNNLWNLYNHILLGLAKSHPRTWMEQQKQVHLHLITEYNLTTFDDEEPVEDQTQFEGDTELGEDLSEMTQEQIDKFNAEQEPVPIETDEEGNVLASAKTQIIDYTEEKTEVMTDEEIQEAEPVDLDAEEDKDWEDKIQSGQIKEVPQLKRVDPVVDPDVNWMTPSEIIAEHGDMLTAEQLEKLGIEVKEEPPKMKIVEAVELYGHVLTEEEKQEIKDNILNDATVQKLRDAHAEATSKVQEIVQDQVEAVIKEEYVKSATDGKTQLPLTEEKLSELNKMVDQGAILPAAPQTSLPAQPKSESQIETPQVEGEKVEELTNEESGIFFMTKSDLNGMFPGVELEKGLVINIADEECEIVGFSEDEGNEEEMVVLEPLMFDEQPEEPAPTGPKVIINKAPAEEPILPTAQPEQIDMNFEIGDADTMVPAEGMLKKQSNSVEKYDEEQVKADAEEQAKIDAAMEKMNAKQDLTPEELAIHEAIEKEVEDLYGSKLPFTYKLSGDQYNVQLESGESFILATSYIDSLIQEA